MSQPVISSAGDSDEQLAQFRQKIAVEATKIKESYANKMDAAKAAARHHGYELDELADLIRVAAIGSKSTQPLKVLAPEHLQAVQAVAAALGTPLEGVD